MPTAVGSTPALMRPRTQLPVGERSHDRATDAAVARSVSGSVCVGSARGHVAARRGTTSFPSLIGVGVGGGVMGLVLGLLASPPTAWFAVVERAVPSAAPGGLVGLACGAFSVLVGRGVRRRARNPGDGAPMVRRRVLSPCTRGTSPVPSASTTPSSSSSRTQSASWKTACSPTSRSNR
jgi:hypothetical protein